MAQLYLSQNASVPMPVKQLTGFQRISIATGETKTVYFKLEPYELCYWSTNLKHYYVENGTYTAKVGGSSDNLPLSINFIVKSDYIIPYGGKNLTASEKINSL